MGLAKWNEMTQTCRSKAYRFMSPIAPLALQMYLLYLRVTSGDGGGWKASYRRIEGHLRAEYGAIQNTGQFSLRVRSWNKPNSF